ncbi:uncharacterized protein LOC111995608 [Quercus suber]|uniref:Transmembrane protein n=1 Tax=Quercus suber TaxID=58331 RepID=A0AAW0M9K5_QUESU|nr:uncharacterized protein LOC111995608 [Quercus suber]POE71781.1 hypothetical protein CFP56_31882 [Quercus suber]
MEQIEDQKFQTVCKFNKFQFLKRTLLFVFSVSLITLFIYYTSGFCFFPYFYNVYFSTFFFSLFTHTIERKYMFLICNGILAILAKSAVSYSASCTENDIGSLENVDLVAEREEVAEAERVEEQEDGSSNTEKEERESEAFPAEDEGIEEEENGVLLRTDGDKELAAAAVNEEFPSTDELNKKFEEFIRKMKEEIRIEAQQHLIAV